MQLFRFTSNQIIIREQDQLNGIYVIFQGSVRLYLQTSLFEEYEVAKLGNYSSYGTYSWLFHPWHPGSR